MSIARQLAAHEQEISEVVEQSFQAFLSYRKKSGNEKAIFLDSIAEQIEAEGDTLIQTAARETNLPAARLTGERARTTMQLRMFATMLREGNWLEASIDTAQPQRAPLPKPDIRKMLFPIGPVIVFGASNFPFAYSTAGGDTASALAAGCSVIVKAHPAHPETSFRVYQAILRAIEKCKMPPKVFQHVQIDNEGAKALVQHPKTAAVGFTGSYSGGKALYDYAHQRKKPIPVFSEMGSINPVIILPDSLEKNTDVLANNYAGSISLGLGQFCTNPGLLIAVESKSLNAFIQTLGTGLSQVTPGKMLHEGIHKSYIERRNKAIQQHGVEAAVNIDPREDKTMAIPMLAFVKGEVFLRNPYLHEEVFGPYSLVVRCRDMDELKNVWKSVAGQLTTSIMGTENDFSNNPDLIDIAQDIAGRIVFNGVPTGVEVCPSMMHGGPFPATTDNRFTAVGIHAVKRWVRPVSFQSCPQQLLPDELKNENPLGIYRLVNNEMTKEVVSAEVNPIQA
ncbi:MAG TPA: aldehyde dehydrogenase (NADP(+)) [Flavitalea sp.]|nr:aldehyde dehydrogenase (NADP(+)) [Flavitalea sp.]